MRAGRCQAVAEPYELVSLNRFGCGACAEVSSASVEMGALGYKFADCTSGILRVKTGLVRCYEMGAENAYAA